MRLLALLLAFAVSSAAAIETKVIKDVPYKDDVISQSPYEQERCKLDLTIPVGAKGFATYVYFYGGGLKKGSKDLASEYCTEIRESLAQSGIAVVTPDYRGGLRLDSETHRRTWWRPTQGLHRRPLRWRHARLARRHGPEPP